MNGGRRKPKQRLVRGRYGFDVIRRPVKPLPIRITGWVYDYWLASPLEMGELVQTDPFEEDSTPRHDDRDEIRWPLVDAVAVDILLEARRTLGDEVWPPDDGVGWNMELSFRPPTPLRSAEQIIVCSYFADPAIADIGNTSVTNGRHRLYSSRIFGSARCPVQSSVMSGWTWDHFGDPDCVRCDHDDRALHNLLGRHQMWTLRDPHADTHFLAGIEAAIAYSADLAEQQDAGGDGAP